MKRSTKSPVSFVGCAIVCLPGILFWAAFAATSLARQPDLETPAAKRSDLDAVRNRDQKRLDKFCREHDCPGATLGMVLAKGRTTSIASGISNKASRRIMQPTDRIFSGSIGKTYVAAVMLQLVEEGRADLDAKISRWFGKAPWFERLPNANDITLHMLMSHTTGIPRHIFTPEFLADVKAEPQRVWRPEELLTFVLDAEPLFPAGKGWSYADTNYILVGMIIGQVTGRTYYEELADRILKPLELRDTTPSDHPDIRGRVSGYVAEQNFLSLPVEVATGGRYVINPQLEWTGGGPVTTAEDLARWCAELYGGEVLKPESHTQMMQGVVQGNNPQRKYGLGVMMRPSPYGPVVGHAGTMPGYLAKMAYYSENKIAVAVLLNTDTGITLPDLESLLDGVVNEFFQANAMSLNE